MEPTTTPFWFKQRQCKWETHAGGLVKVSGPNLADAYLSVQSDDRWTVALRLSADGPDVAAAQADQPNAQSAWETAFELYRTHVIA